MFDRLMMTTAKKSYASLVTLQEGNLIPENKQLDVKGIECFVKSTKKADTKARLKKILLEDILKASKIDPIKVIKDIAIFEKEIIESIRSGSKQYFKPATIKSLNSYEDPMRIQGVKASYVWNAIKPDGVEAIDLSGRSAIDIAKVRISRLTAEDIKDTYPEVYNKIITLFDEDEERGFTKEIDKKTGKEKKKDNRIFKGVIEAVAIPLELEVPDWLKEFINYNSIVEDNIKGFPYESVGITRLDKAHVNYTNIVSL